MKTKYIQGTYPAAHDPAAAPPLFAHSLAVKQVPFLWVLPPAPLWTITNKTGENQFKPQPKVICILFSCQIVILLYISTKLQGEEYSLDQINMNEWMIEWMNEWNIYFSLAKTIIMRNVLEW